MIVRSKALIASLVAAAAALSLAGLALASASASYWLVSSTGQVFAYGKAKTHGSEAGKRFKGTITGIKGTKDGDGYWIVTSKARYSFGDATRAKYVSGGLKRYTGKTKPEGLKGKVVGYAVALLPAGKSTPPSKTTTTATQTTPTTTTPPGPTGGCGGVSILTSLNDPIINTAYSETLSGGGVSGGTWSWQIISGSLPSGLSFSTTGAITGTPAESDAGASSSSLTVQATNSQCPANPVTRGYTLTVGVPAMSITTTSLPGAVYGVAYDATLAAIGGQAGDYVWSSTTLPSGLSLSSGGVLSGTPGTSGNASVQFTVSDSTGDTPPVSVDLTLSLALPPLQITSPTSLAAGQSTVAYSSQTFTATGGTAMEFSPADRSAMYDWSATGLPTGMAMSTGGTLSGTPTASGIYTVAVTLTDAEDTSSHITQDFSLSIADAPLAFTTTTFTVVPGQSFTGQIVAQGGQAPYTVSLLAGSLPTGLTFDDGTISGATTDTYGEYQFTVGVSDSQSTPATAQETFNLWIPPSSEASPDLSVSTTESQNTNWSGYVEQSVAAFTAVSGTFTVPSIPAAFGDSASTWIGIDGDSDDTLIQAGASEVESADGPVYQAWWDTLGSIGSPQLLPPQNVFDVSPGDTINVDIWGIGGGEWWVTLNDLTSGEGFADEVSYSGTDKTAEWVTEGSLDNPALFYNGTVTFSNLTASQAGSGMIDLSMAGAYGTSLTSTLTSSGFTTTN